MAIKVVVVAAATTFAATTLEHLAGVLGLIAGMIVSLGIMLAAGRTFWRFVRGLESVVENTRQLPEFMAEQRATNERVQVRLTEENAKVHERLDAGADRMARIEGSLQAWADAERVGITTAVELSNKIPEPRPPRRTDPAPRTGWRE